MKKRNLILGLLLLPLALLLSGCATNPPRPGFSIFGNKPAPNKNLKEYTADLTRNNFKTYHFLDNTVLVSKPIEYVAYPNGNSKPGQYSFFKISRAYYRECKNLGGSYKTVINNLNQYKPLQIPNTTGINKFIIAVIRKNEKNKFTQTTIPKIFQQYKQKYKVRGIPNTTFNCNISPSRYLQCNNTSVGINYAPNRYYTLYVLSGGTDGTLENICLLNNHPLFTIYIVTYFTNITRNILPWAHIVEGISPSELVGRERFKRYESGISKHYYFYPANIFAVVY